MLTKALAEQPETPGPERIYAIGDVHGHADRLLAMHDTIRQDLLKNPVGSSLLVHIGDYIDRGPDSAGAIALLVDGSPITGVPAINLMGNHERMLLDALDRPARAPHWLQNGGFTTLQSWGIPLELPPERWGERIPPDHLAFLEALPLSCEASRYVFVHAGVRPGIPFEQQRPHDLLWIREGFLDWDGIMLPEAPDQLIVHGHTPARTPELRPNRIGIDTNAARGGKLTCAALSRDSVYFLQV